MKWIAKAVIQKSISFLPQKERANYLFQKHVTKAVQLTDQHFEWKIEHARDHLAFMKKNGLEFSSDKEILELGTGWYPIIPMAFFLSGFNHVTSIDIYNWMTRESFVTTFKKFEEWKQQGMLKQYLPNLIEDRWQKLLDLTGDKTKERDELCAFIGLQNHLIDARKTGFKTGTFDFITSNNTFEHIPKVVLVDILKEFKRLLKPSGLMSHFIDMTDHFAHFDQSITIYNFLQFSNSAWNRIDNSIQPQNRMRWADYKELYHRLEIPFEEAYVRPGNVEEVKSVKLAKEFQKYSISDLAITHGYLVSSFGR